MSSAYQQAGIKDSQDMIGEGKHGREFALSMPTVAVRKLASGWLWLGIASLLGAGLFAILLVLSRTPYIQDIFPWVDFFRTALVVHVDLSVLLWFLAFAGVLWSLNSSSKFIGLGWLALVLAAGGAAMIVLSPICRCRQTADEQLCASAAKSILFLGIDCFWRGHGSAGAAQPDSAAFCRSVEGRGRLDTHRVLCRFRFHAYCPGRLWLVIHHDSPRFG